jgi:CheY-like chemotaxis protein
LNARDAAPSGGKLTIETANVMLDENYIDKDREVVPGQYVMLAVSDTGSGMSEEVVKRVFEPFFTTKESGRGTGLGLSMVYGFVKQSGGHVTIYSELGEGTTVKLYFPRYRGALETRAAPAATLAREASHDEIILVVEDNDDVRAYSVDVIKGLGFKVLEAANADDAMQVIEKAPRIDLLFTDVVLPGKNGRLLAEEARAKRPGLNVLYTTGYSRNAIIHQGRLEPGISLITKPFTREQLAESIRKILDRC